MLRPNTDQVARTGDQCRRVLIVDESPDSREVLRTALDRRGVQTFEARQTSEGLKMAQQCDPDVIVWDLEAFSADPPTDPSGLGDRFNSQTAGHNTSFVFLGEARGVPASFPRGQFIRKPYHYAPLIRKIEELLGVRLDVKAAAEPKNMPSA